MRCSQRRGGPSSTHHDLVVSLGSDNGSRNVGLTQEFLVHELPDAHVAELATITGVFDSAEWQLGIRPVNVVDEHYAGVHTVGQAFPARSVLGKNKAAQPEVRIVGKRDRLTFVFQAEEHRDRPEELVAEGRVVRLDIRCHFLEADSI